MATEAPETPQEPPGEALQPAPTVDSAALAPLLTALQSNQVKGEQLHVLDDRTKRHDRDINQLRWFMVAVVLVLVLVVILLLIVVLR